VAVRRAVAGDLIRVRELWEEYAHELAESRRTPWTWSWNDVAPRLRNAGVFVAEVEGRPAGFVIGSRSRGDVGHVEDLYVRPAERGVGIATTLLLALATAFRERGVVHVALDVDAGNEAARALYTRLGFDLYAERFSADVASLEERLAATLTP